MRSLSVINFILTVASADLFFKNYSFSKTIRLSNGLDRDQDLRLVGPVLGPNC